MEIGKILSAIAVCGFVYLAVRAWNIWWVTPKKLERCLREQGFTGNPYRLFFGDQKESGLMIKEALSKPIKMTDDVEQRVTPHILKTVNTYGNKSFMWVGRIPRLNITEPALVREILTKSNKFQKNHKAFDPVTKTLLTGTACIEGEKWAKHRKIINPAFHVEKLKLMLPAFYSCCLDIASKWEKMVLAAGGSCEVDVWPDLELVTGDVISRTLFGSSYGEGKEALSLMKELAELTFQVIKLVYIPGRSRFFPNKTMRRMKEIDKIVQVLLKDIINKRLKDMKAGKALSDDLLGLLLKSNMKEIEEHRDDKLVGLTIDDIVGECKLFHFAGHDSTSSLLSWSMYFLSRYPKWQKLAREEVLQFFGKGIPDFDGLNRLKVVSMIIHEVLRIHPPVIELTKMTVEETQLGNYKLPPGVQVMVPQVLIHHDTEIWGPDAKEFNPERFAEGASKAVKTPVSYFPFSWGPRMCVGQNFALLEAKMALSLILQRFSFELSPAYVHVPYTVISLLPQQGLPLILRQL